MCDSSSTEFSVILYLRMIRSSKNFNKEYQARNEKTLALVQYSILGMTLDKSPHDEVHVHSFITKVETGIPAPFFFLPKGTNENICKIL